MSMPTNFSSKFDKVIALYANLSKFTRPTDLKSDDDFDKANQKELQKRDEIYTALLKDFQILYSNRQQKKEIKKWLFFHIVLWSWGLFGASVLAVLVIAAVKATDMLSFLPVMVTSVVSIVTSIIVIPEIVTKYLFNPNEDNEITKMIIEMQKHDLSNRGMIKDKTPDKEHENKPDKQNEKDFPM